MNYMSDQLVLDCRQFTVSRLCFPVLYGGGLASDCRQGCRSYRAGLKCKFLKLGPPVTHGFGGLSDLDSLTNSKMHPSEIGWSSKALPHEIV